MNKLIAGIDEAGRGCLAGSVVAAAVILPEGLVIEGLTDSKKLSAKQRESLFEIIHEKAIAVGVGQCSVEEVDRLNILHAAMEAMRRAALALDPQPHHLMIDGNRCFTDCLYSYETIVKGDLLHPCISAASVIAKVTRDRIMMDLHQQFPQYGWDKHKGYGTKAHYQAIAEHGISPHHRRSFRLL